MNTQPTQDLWMLSRARQENRRGVMSYSLTISLVLNLLIIGAVSKASHRPLNDRARTILITEIFEAAQRGNDKHSSAVMHKIAAEGVSIGAATLEPVQVTERAKHQALNVGSSLKTSNPSSPLALQSLTPKRRVFTHQPARRITISDHKQLKENYVRMIKQQIQRHFPPLNQEMSKNLNDRVLLRVTIKPVSGNVVDSTLLKRSKHWILNEAALAAVRRASPFPPLTNDEGLWHINIPIIYKGKNISLEEN